VLDDAADVVEAGLERSAYLLPANTGLPPFQIDWWQCMPEPLSP
jgi:hypothetical protein